MTRRTLCMLASRPRAAMLAAALCACSCDGGADDGNVPACVSRDASACMPLYEPSWDRVFTETIAPRCGTPGTACHGQASAAGAGGGLVVSDMAATHAALLDGGFVVASDEACSELMVRLDTSDAALRMPPGAQALDEPERCAVARWIADGATP
jgi:hypothetical protein